MKIVINKCFGGFGLSHEAVMLYTERKGNTVYPVERISTFFGTHDYYSDSTYKTQWWPICGVERNDPILVGVVEELGEAAGDDSSKLKVVEIPDDVDWVIHDYDGIESIHEVHRIWS